MNTKLTKAYSNKTLGDCALLFVHSQVLVESYNNNLEDGKVVARALKVAYRLGKSGLGDTELEELMNYVGE